MKIAHINVEWNTGGPGTIANDICEVSIKNNIDCLAAYGRGSANIVYPSYKIDTHVEFILHTVLSRVFGNEGAWSFFATKRLIKKLDEFKPDIVHLHTLLGHYLNHELLFEYVKEKNIEVVWTIHDCSPFTGHCINFDRVRCEKWKNECNRCPLSKEYPYSLFFDTSKSIYNKRKKMYGNMTNLHLVVPSVWMKSIIKKSFLSKVDTVVINNGIDLSKFSRKKTNLREQYNIDKKVVLLAVAYNWNEMKGWNILNRLSAILDERFALVVIGNKDEKAIHKNIISIPSISDKERLIEWYSSADIFLNPTLGDNFPTVNIEALSCGLPIVTCNTGGSPEIAGNEVGRIVYSNTPEEFLEKIIECVEKNYNSEYCHAYAQKYDRNSCYKKYIELYKNIMEKNHVRQNS